jgi:hypothetical protein
VSASSRTSFIFLAYQSPILIFCSSPRGRGGGGGGVGFFGNFCVKGKRSLKSHDEDFVFVHNVFG